MQEGNEIFFKVKRSTGFRKIMTAYCDRTGKSFNDVRFTFDGERINPDSTPAAVSPDDADLFSCFRNIYAKKLQFDF